MSKDLSKFSIILLKNSVIINQLVGAMFSFHATGILWELAFRPMTNQIQDNCQDIFFKITTSFHFVKRGNNVIDVEYFLIYSRVINIFSVYICILLIGFLLGFLLGSILFCIENIFYNDIWLFLIEYLWFSISLTELVCWISWSWVFLKNSTSSSPIDIMLWLSFCVIKKWLCLLFKLSSGVTITFIMQLADPVVNARWRSSGAAILSKNHGKLYSWRGDSCTVLAF